MNSSEKTRRKFCACTTATDDQIKKWKLPEEAADIEKGIDLEAFRKLMYKHDMEEYTILLLPYIRNLQITKSTYDLNSQDHKDCVNHQKDLTEVLIFLLDEKKGNSLSLTFHKSKESYTITNRNIIEPIIELIMKEYIDHGFNSDMPTDEELEVLKGKDIKDLDQDLVEGLIIHHKHYFGMDSEDYEIDYEHIKRDYLDSVLIEREVDLESLKNMKEKHFSCKRKAGAKPKNRDIEKLANDLVTLKRVDIFLNQKDIVDIEEINLENKDYRFIHDCLSFFGLIKDYSMNVSNSTTPEKYIRTLLQQAKDPFYMSEIDPARIKEDRISKFCKLKSKMVP